MKKLLFFLFTISTFSVEAQSIESLLTVYNQKTVPYISVEELKKNYDQFTILDTRKKAEYEVSHLPSAIWVGEKLNKKDLKNIPDNLPIVVYCTVGVRSENFGEELLNAGFSRVFNLHGSIFSWKDAGNDVVDSDGNTTEKVHVFSKEWERYLKTGEKVY
ncbi:rhodanese-like domain-containing protein [Nonlabens sp.]|uniref:rhodanese-like domain-containing protein n=1 Tax=Nonlabens sp. TaxID=1888209 RepID=UPI003F69FF85